MGVGVGVVAGVGAGVGVDNKAAGTLDRLVHGLLCCITHYIFC